MESKAKTKTELIPVIVDLLKTVAGELVAVEIILKH
jgi:hypothetical protein